MVTMEAAIQSVRRQSLEAKQAQDAVDRVKAVTTLLPPVTTLLPPRTGAELRESLRQSIGQTNNRKLLSNTIRAGIGGLGLGLGVGGLYNLFRQSQRNLRKPVSSVSAPTMLDVPVQVSEDEKEAQDGAIGSATKAVSDAVSEPGFVNEVVIPFFKGKLQRTSTGDPRWWLTVPTAGAAGFGGGLALQKWLHNRRRKEELNTELERAKGDYMQALSPKLAEEQGTLANDLDQLFDAVQEKQGGDGWFNNPDTWGNIVGAAALVSLLSGGVGMYGGYQHGKKFQKRRLLEEAQKQRRRQRFNRQPGAILAQPLPTPVPAAIDDGDSFQAAPSLNETENQLQ